MMCFLGILLMAFYDVMRAIVTLLKCLSDHVIHPWLPRWWVPGENSTSFQGCSYRIIPLTHSRVTFVNQVWSFDFLLYEPSPCWAAEKRKDLPVHEFAVSSSLNTYFSLTYCLLSKIQLAASFNGCFQILWCLVNAQIFQDALSISFPRDGTWANEGTCLFSWELGRKGSWVCGPSFVSVFCFRVFLVCSLDW